MTRDDNRNGDQTNTSNSSPPVPPPTQQIPDTVSSIKLPILKKGEYNIWAMKMEHYLSHIDYPIWKVIQNDNEVVARERERKARTTLLMALPEDHLAKFHKMVDAKEMWEAIKSIFGGLHKGYDRFQTLLSQLEIQGNGVSHRDGLHKGYDRFQTLLSQLEIQGNGVSHRDVNQKFLRSLPSSCTNDVSTAYSVSSPSVSKSQKEGSLSYTDEVIHSFFANQSSAPQLDYDDLEQINNNDMEKMDLKWQ
nr:hypothetical protein [Tanacetum cinerariifolium]